MEDYDIRYKDDGCNRDRAGEYREQKHHPEKGKNLFSFSPHGHRAEYVLMKVEESVYSAFGRKPDQKLSSMEAEKQKGDHGKAKKAVAGAEDEDSSKDKPEFTPFKISKWRNKKDDLGNKLGHKHEHKYEDDLENKEPPSMITDGGWVRPNRAMWASPPGSLAYKPTGSASDRPNSIGDALEYLKQDGARAENPTGNSGSRATGVEEGLDYLKQAGGTATGNSGSRLTVGVPVRTGRDGYNGKPPVREVAGRRGMIDSREAERRYGGIRV